MTDALRRLPFVAVLVLAPVLVLGLATHARAGESSPVNTRCPVMPDEVVDPMITVEHEGQTVAFCCQRCRRQFLENPGAFASNLPAPGGATTHSHGSESGSVDPGHDEREGGVGHDHDTDHDHGDHGGGRLVRFAGKFHPMVVHFPIALGIAAALAELMLLVTGGDVFGGAARFCAAFAGVGALVAAPLGWAAAAFASYPEDLTGNLVLHRWMGTGAAILLVLVAVFSELHRRRSDPRLRLAYRALLFSTVPIVGIVGHLGATLVFGPAPFAW